MTLRRRWVTTGLLVVAVAATACGDDGGSGGADDVYAAACGEDSEAAGARAPAIPAAFAAALPPEDVEELLPMADDVVVAEVSDVLYDGTDPPGPEPDPDVAGPLPDERCQVVLLDVGEVLVGSETGEIEVVKPQQPYTLEDGDEGVFFLEGTSPDPTILGLYGPADYTVADVERALRKQQ